jgi:hypothetical protein
MQEFALPARVEACEQALGLIGQHRGVARRARPRAIQDIDADRPGGVAEVEQADIALARARDHVQQVVGQVALVILAEEARADPQQLGHEHLQQVLENNRKRLPSVWSLRIWRPDARERGLRRGKYLNQRMFNPSFRFTLTLFCQRRHSL